MIQKPKVCEIFGATWKDVLTTIRFDNYTFQLNNNKYIIMIRTMAGKVVPAGGGPCIVALLLQPYRHVYTCTHGKPTSSHDPDSDK